ncbi:MmgE/PrpD family protein [Enterocloster lavalensis]|uniref:2-methylcitrate dehydratase PrpD n=1 Tax=Enterocloster lavalensis TaxID=460384 RepID=A0A1I0AG01_9FIRM|nr:MmgE/PrpD family protein [Enterocloster lavalensis]PST33319.1 MmgE/PrpD family protein [Enterocloster lavalensis]SES93196.1 2-methylcitrate dehydratase PrpD [Enterocloster lavalensis]
MELRDLAHFLTNLELKNIPKIVKKTANLCILDSVGVAIGAKENPQIQNVLRDYLEICGNKGSAHIWGTGKRVPLLTAIFMNAMMGHTLELDDVHTDSKTHIGTVVVPAAWSMAEYLGKTGDEFLLAVICGYETMARIGMALGVSAHRNLGWHVTSTAGTFGAAAACAKLLGLDEDQTVSALGLAGTQSFGTWAFLTDGATNKVLHPARAAASGCEAALLAKAGMTGPEFILTAEDGGLFNNMTNEPKPEMVANGLGEKWYIMEMDNKPYPCCRSTHCTIDGTLSLRRQGLRAEDVESIEVRTYLVGNKQCGMSDGSRNPKKPVDAKFSTPFTVAAALLYGEVTLEHFKEEYILRPEIQELLHKVTVVTDGRFTEKYPDHWGCRVIAICKDGRVMEQEVEDASGSVYNPLSEEQVRSKVTALVRETCGAQAEEIVAAILSLSGRSGLPVV